MALSTMILKNSNDSSKANDNVLLSVAIEPIMLNVFTLISIILVSVSNKSFSNGNVLYMLYCALAAVNNQQLPQLTKLSWCFCLNYHNFNECKQFITC